MPEKRIFFISRAGADERWATLIASVVREAGHEAFSQDENFRVGQGFIDNMTLAAEADCTIAVLSRAYLESEYCLSELSAALAADPLGRRGKIIPVRVERVDIPSLPGHLAYLDLVGADDDTARQRLMTTLLRHGQVDATKLALVGRTRRIVEQANRNRSAMIEKVRTIWINGVLQQSLFHETRVLLHLSERADAVAGPLDLLVERPGEGERSLPPGTQVVNVFDKMDRALLILGAPGSGKTTLLLELARDLLTRATHDATQPIPVVYKLSTWAQSRKPLVDWMAEELNVRYFVSIEVAEDWVATDQVLPLLDGLDEVKVGCRAACIAAINSFRQSHGLLPLVVTSRRADYEAEGARLQLQSAIVLRPLSSDQVHSYLAALGPSGEPVAEALRDDPSLRDLLDTPLMLNVLTMVFSERSDALRLEGDPSERRDRLFGTYVDKVLRRHAVEPRYSPDRTVAWLRWLARQMARHDQTVFYIERLQPDWLSIRQRALFMPAVGLSSGLGVASIVFLVYGMFVGPTMGFLSAVIVGIGGILVGPTIESLLKTSIKGDLSQEIINVEPRGWSFAKTLTSNRKRRPNRIVFGLLLGSAAGLIQGLMTGRARGALSGILTGTAFALMFFVVGLIFLGLLFMIQDGLYYNDISLANRPNQGIRTTLRNSILLACLFVVFLGVPVGTVAGTFLWYMDLRNSVHRAIPAFLLASGLLGWFLHGGSAAIKHFVVRVLLAWNGDVPLRLTRFLDFSCHRILLQRVGSGYQFIHNSLLDHLASRGYSESV